MTARDDQIKAKMTNQIKRPKSKTHDKISLWLALNRAEKATLFLSLAEVTALENELEVARIDNQNMVRMCAAWRTRFDDMAKALGNGYES